MTDSADLSIVYYATGTDESFDCRIDYGISSISSHIGDETIGNGNGTYNIILDNLKPNTAYYVQPFIYAGGNRFDGDKFEFTTNCSPLGCGPAGGFIIYDDGNGGGIEVVDTSFGAYWGCSGTLIPAIADSVGSGLNNNLTMLILCSETGIASEISSNITYNGYSDWYVPSIDELQLIYEQVYLTGYWDFQTTFYSSSSQSNSTMIKSLNFNNGTIVESQKSNYHQYLIVRTF
jgi:hypothetical protein